MLPHKVCKLPVLSVEFNDAYPVLDFLQKHMISVRREPYITWQAVAESKHDITPKKGKKINQPPVDSFG